MKVFLLSLLALLPFFSLAQNVSDISTYTFPNGFKVSIGDSLQIGTGKKEDSSYKYLQSKKGLTKQDIGMFALVKGMRKVTYNGVKIDARLIIQDENKVTSDLGQALASGELLMPGTFKGSDLNDFTQRTIGQGFTKEYDPIYKGWRVETKPVKLPGGKFTSIYFRSMKGSIFFGLSSQMWAIGTIGKYDLATFLFQNDSTMSIAPKEIQSSIGYGSYDHEYTITFEQVQLLATNKVKMFRRVYNSNYADLPITDEAGSRIMSNAQLFLKEYASVDEDNSAHIEINLPSIKTQPISIADELIKLKKLRDEGVLTEEEFQGEKKKLLGK